MNAFKKASEISSRESGYPPEAKGVILKHLKTFGRPVTVTSTIIELNKNRIDLSRQSTKLLLDKLVESGNAYSVKKGNVMEYYPAERE